MSLKAPGNLESCASFDMGSELEKNVNTQGNRMVKFVCTYIRLRIADSYKGRVLCVTLYIRAATPKGKKMFCNVSYFEREYNEMHFAFTFLPFCGIANSSFLLNICGTHGCLLGI